METTHQKWYKENKEHWDAYMKDYTKKNYQVQVSILYGVHRTNDPTKKIVYIGECITTLAGRIARHKHDALTRNFNYPFAQAIREEGWDAFEFIVLTDKYSEKFTEDYFIQMLSPELNDKAGNKVRQVRKGFSTSKQIGIEEEVSQ